MDGKEVTPHRALYVIPDIHGYKAKLDWALRRVEAEGGPGARIVFLGDYVDRGPDSRGVIQTLIDGMKAGRDWVPLRGNHDQLFLDFLEGRMSAAEQDSWCTERMGGRETLASYGAEPGEMRAEVARRIPPDHRAFLADLPHAYETEELFLCHAGVRPGVALDDQDPGDLMWLREPFLSDRSDHGKLVVHGHSPVEVPEHHGNRVALDCGAGWGRELIVAVFEGREAWILTDAGRVALRP